MPSKAFRPLLCFLWSAVLVAVVSGFSPSSIGGSRITTNLYSTTKEEAAALTDFMAKAHEEKIRAMSRVEAKYKDQIAELQAKVAELEGPNTGSQATSENSYAFPATNKLLTEKVQAYQSFLSDYIVKASLEKQKAVKSAEDKLVAKYEAIIEDLKKQ